MIRGERREVQQYLPSAPEEIRQLLERRGRNMREDEEKRLARISNENGINIESEYSFSMAVGRFTRMAKEEGRYWGKEVKNILEQLKMKTRFEGKGKVRKTVVVIGASEAGRLVEEMEKIGEQLVDTSQMIKIRGEWTVEKIDHATQEAKLMEAVPDKIVIMGPWNSQVKHGRLEVRGKGPERKIVYNEDMSIRVEYHLTEPSRISLGEKEKLVGLVETLTDERRSEFPGVDVLCRVATQAC
jgi:hypothetical protein